MAHGQYIGINNVTRKVKQPYIGVDNVARKIIKGYTGANNVARLSHCNNIGNLDVGTYVWVPYNDGFNEFVVIHQGLPDATIYDRSCDGTWLMKKNTVARSYFRVDSGGFNFPNSIISSYLNGDFYNNFNLGMQQKIKQIKLPCTNGGYGINELIENFDTKIFILSYAEVGAGGNDGAKLDYFMEGNSEEACELRKCGFMSFLSDNSWWLRSAYYGHTVCFVGDNGMAYYSYSITEDDGSLITRYVRPAFILPSETFIDQNYKIIVD